jgi:hypothetical protein
MTLGLGGLAPTMQTAPSVMGSCDPFNFPTVYDVITFGSVDSPGHCKVSGFKRAYKFDTKEGKGTAGATSTLTGLPPAKGKVKFWAWMASHFVQWDSFVVLLKQYPTKQAVNAASFYYPTCADIDVNQVTTTEIGIWEDEGGGYWAREVEFLEYAPTPPVSVTSTPTTAVENVDPNAGGSGSGQTPAEQDQAEIANLLAQVQAP